MSHVSVLAGGLASAKFLVGLGDVLPEEQIHVIVNVGDDGEEWGLHSSPDIDCILHALAGELNPAKDWQREGESFRCYGTARRLGLKSTRKIGDRDLATRLARHRLLKQGLNIGEATRELAECFGLGVSIFPATNDRVRTRVQTADGDMSVAEYYAAESAEARAVRYEGAGTAQASARVVDSIMTASRVIVAPVDPVRTLDAMLAIRGLRDALVRTEAGVVAVSPIVGSQLVGDSGGRGPGLTRFTGWETVSALAIVERYRDFVDRIVIHTSDLPELDRIRAAGVDVWVENILMSTLDDARRLAGRVANEKRSVARSA